MATALEIEGEPAVHGRCRFCSDETTVYGDSGLCDTCDQESVWCAICGERLDGSDSAPCRHLMWIDGVGWGGLGVGHLGCYSIVNRWARDCMWRVAGALGLTNARRLSAALRSHRYHFFYTDSMLGGSMHLHLTFQTLGFDEAWALQEGIQEWVNWLQRNDCRGDSLVEAIQSLWCLWAGDRKGKNWGLKRTRKWDTFFADAIDEAMASYT